MQALYCHLLNGKTTSPAKYPAPFIERHQSLVKLHLWGLDNDTDYRVLEVLLKLPHLKEVGLRKSSIQEDDIVRFWTVCENLESLLLEEVTFPQGTTPHALMCFRNIRKLQLYSVSGMEDAEQLRFISACPNLEDLAWRANTPAIRWGDAVEGGFQFVERPYLGEFAKEVTRKRWPRLTSFRREAQ
ncbi:hypothetical protein EDD21DRAFT_366122 [Dissophora ornata]|nr:hypothetical protein EDD21DRAFT_366122 [Dissophora ornata]